jgi:Clp protease
MRSLITKVIHLDIFCASLFAATIVANAEVRIDRSAEAFIELSIFGAVTERHAKTFAGLSHDLEYKNAFVDLNSEGGSVSAAMQIGRLIRKYDATTAVPENGKCYSSCALIFIAGVERRNFGQVGLHRPYFAAAPQSRETIEKQVPLMLSVVNNYITEMGVTDNFYQQMVNTEPSKVAIYNGKDIERLVPAIDPTYQEIETSYQARRYGVTTSEMRQRQQDWKSCLKVVPYNDNCIGSAVWGLSERVYVERDKKVKAECWFEKHKLESDKDVKTLFSIPRKARRDHPITIRRETCERNIMLGR